MKKIVFITATRADFGKLKTLIKKVDSSEQLDCHVFVTGMHMLSRYGGTWKEVTDQKFNDVFYFINQSDNAKMDIVLADTITGFNHYVQELKPDMVVVHGDRVEPLAAALVASFNNILLAHIEGGEVSGTIDESIRHSISKLAQIHFVANKVAKNRLMRMGESENNIFVIGSPDIDVMYSKNLPSIEEVKSYYEIPFDNYHVFMYHPVTTEVDNLQYNMREVIAGLKESGENFVAVYPNNDEGSKIILNELEKLKNHNNFRVLPSFRFEYFLMLLKNAKSIVGNSSAGIREAEVYGIPSINIGSRQENRSMNESIIHIPENSSRIVEALASINMCSVKRENNFGEGDSTEKFFEVISNKEIFKTDIQKTFNDSS